MITITDVANAILDGTLDAGLSAISEAIKVRREAIQAAKIHRAKMTLVDGATAIITGLTGRFATVNGTKVRIDKIKQKKATCTVLSGTDHRYPDGTRNLNVPLSVLECAD